MCCSREDFQDGEAGDLPGDDESDEVVRLSIPHGTHWEDDSSRGFSLVVVGKITKFDKVLKQEIFQVTSKGARVFMVQDGEPVEAGSVFLMTLIGKVTLDVGFLLL